MRVVRRAITTKKLLYDLLRAAQTGEYFPIFDFNNQSSNNHRGASEMPFEWGDLRGEGLAKVRDLLRRQEVAYGGKFLESLKGEHLTLP